MDIQIGSNAIYTASMQVFNYRVDVGGVTIYRGRAIASPSGRVTVNVSNIVEDYLNSDEFPKRNVDPILYSEDGGYVKARLYRINADETTTLVGEYNFLRSYDIDWSAGIYDSREEVWTGQSITMSNPINGRLDPRMQQLYTVYRRTSGETISWGIVPKFRIVPNKIIADPDGGSYTLIIEANVPFTATTDSGWISISGSGDTYVVTVTPNPGEDRNGGIILSYLDENDNPATTVIPVVQEALSARIIPETINFGPDGGESRFTVVSNVDVTPTTSADWLTFVPVRTGDGFVTYKLVAASNRDNTEGRTATINARGAVLNINQEAFAVTVEVDKTEYDWEGDEGTLTVTANGYYEITTNVDWIRVSPSVGYSGVTNFEIEVDENETASARTGYINVGGTLIEITQKKQAWVSIKPETWTFPATGGSEVFQISDRQNHGWKITGGGIFVYSQTEGTGSTEITISIGAASSTSSYTAVPKLIDMTTGEEIQFVLKRKAPVITVTPSTISAPASGETYTFTVFSEINYRLSADSDWITLSATGGTAGTTEFTATVNPNATMSEKTGHIKVFNANKITVTQEAAGAEVCYLTFNIISGGTINWKATASSIERTISYSLDDGENWTNITSSTGATPVQVSAGDTVLLKGENGSYYDNSKYATFSGSTATFNVRGNIMSLIYGDNFIGQTAINYTYTFAYLFRNTNVVGASDLIMPSERLTDWCYYGMFYSCDKLVTSPALPATLLASNCYSHMFWYCSSLTSAPALPATTLAESCYESMFDGCSSLTTAPALPALNLANECYYAMFAGCSSLTTAPELPATTLADTCYSDMFSRCTNLVSTPPALPATAATYHCYSSMFQGCTSITSAPELPATILGAYSYDRMFSGCTSLSAVTVNLPATALTEDCYYGMFAGCSSLVTAPIIYGVSTEYRSCYAMFSGCTSLSTVQTSLYVTTLSSNCFYRMFRGCSSLTTAPALPANTLAFWSNNEMFRDCSSLRYIKCLATDITAEGCLNNWLLNVSGSGTFVKKSGSSWPTGASGIPTGWTVEEV